MRQSLSSEPRPFAVEVGGGVTVGGLDWGGPRRVPVLLLLHPNGFCAGVFHPVAWRLAAVGACRPIGIDLRGHGASTALPATPENYAYARLAEDVLGVLDALGVDRVLAMGESLGGGVTVVLDAVAPGLVERVLLCEPVAMPPFEGAGAASRDNHMSTAARRRKRVWPSRDAMIASYGARPPLNELAPEALESYVRWGTVDRADGTVELACPPEVEATIFESGTLGPAVAWEHLPALRGRATIVAGTTSSLPATWFELQARHAGVPLVRAFGGHFFVQSDAEAAVRLVKRYLLQS